MTRVFIGIDPGKKGAYAFVLENDDGTQNMFAKAWDDQAFAENMRWFALEYGCENMFCVVEKVGAMPGQGVTSMFSFGKSCGYIEGVLRALMIPYQLVPPKTWKKEWSLTNDKQQSIDACKKLYPNISLKATDRCRTDSDGLAEALLMATYAKRHC